MSFETEKLPDVKTFLDIGISPFFIRTFEADEVRAGDHYIGLDLPYAMSLEGAKARIFNESDDSDIGEKHTEITKQLMKAGRLGLEAFIRTTNTQFQMIHGDGTELPFRDHSIDMVGMQNVIGDLSINDLTKCMLIVEALRVAKSGMPVRVVDTYTPDDALKFFTNHSISFYADIAITMQPNGVSVVELTTKD